MSEEKTCPNCGGGCCRDEVDVGVGIIYGPWGCWSCRWSEYVIPANINPDKVEPLGGYYPGNTKRNTPTT